MSQFANWLTTEIVNMATNYSQLEQKIEQLQYEVNKLKAMLSNMEVQTTSMDLSLSDTHGRTVSVDSYYTEHEVYITCTGPGADAVAPHADNIDYCNDCKSLREKSQNCDCRGNGCDWRSGNHQK